MRANRIFPRESKLQETIFPMTVESPKDIMPTTFR
jgi:hypothetical protein